MKTFDIPISKNYIDNWGISEAIREIRANAEDGAVDNKFGLEYNHFIEEIFIWNKAETKLTASSLVLGGTTKDEGDSNIGQFGEGLKLALVVLLREGASIVVHNKNEIWTPSFKHSETYEIETLHVDITENPIENKVVSFTITGVSAEAFEAFESTLLSTYLPHLDLILENKTCNVYSTDRYKEEIKEAQNKHNTRKEKPLGTTEEEDNIHYMLMRKARETTSKMQGIYVGGQFVYKHDSRFLIDFKPKAVKLSRDRNTIENKNSLESKAIADALIKNYNQIRTEDAEWLANSEDLNKLTKTEKTEVREALLLQLGVPKNTKTLLINSIYSLQGEAERLKIELPENLVDVDYTTQILFRKLGIKCKRFEHPILTTSLHDILELFKKNNRKVLEKNKLMAKNLDLILEVANDWRGV